LKCFTIGNDCILHLDMYHQQCLKKLGGSNVLSHVSDFRGQAQYDLPHNFGHTEYQKYLLTRRCVHEECNEEKVWERFQETDC
jgi:hypothetical protein